jgi:hypothetical protein
MEKTKKRSRKTGGKGIEDNIKDQYKNYLLTEGQRPASVYKFCLDVGISEDQFYNLFGSFNGLEKEIWNGFIETTIHRLTHDPAFSGFSTREKILAFYFTLLEELKQHRSFVLLQLEREKKPTLVPTYLTKFKATFETFFSSLLEAGKGSGEVANRPVLDKRYPQLFWLHLGFVLMFWRDDNSAGFENTDAAVEKSINLAFDLIGKGAVDTAIDFAKFLYQNSKI